MFFPPLFSRHFCCLFWRTVRGRTRLLVRVANPLQLTRRSGTQLAGTLTMGSVSKEGAIPGIVPEENRTQNRTVRSCGKHHQRFLKHEVFAGRERRSVDPLFLCARRLAEELMLRKNNADSSLGSYHTMPALAHVAHREGMRQARDSLRMTT